MAGIFVRYRIEIGSERLQKLLDGNEAIGYVESHTEPELFEAAQRMDLEGIVAKRQADPYTVSVEWVKVKHPTYSQIEGRWELFSRR